MTSLDARDRRLCLPVTKDNDRFVPDVSQSDSLEQLPLYAELGKYLQRHYSRTTGALEWKGLNFEADIFIPHDVEDCAYAVVDEALFRRSAPESLQPSSVIQSLRVWLTNNISYSEPAPLGDATRLRTEFVDSRVQIWEGKHASGKVLPWRDILKRGRVVVLGEPGTGKTTLLRMVALHEANQLKETQWWRLPIYMALRQFGECGDILNLARSTLDHQTSMKTQGEFDSALASGRLLLILDGLDEVPDAVRRSWAEKIVRLCEERPKIGIYIGTRQAAYDWHFPGFLHAKIEPFDSMQVQEWLRLRLTRSDKDLTLRLISALTAEVDLRNLASTPLMLSLLASVFERTGMIPRRKADLISRYLEVLLETWDASRGVRRYTHSFLREDKIEALGLIALESWKKSRLNFSEEAFCSLQQSWSPLRSREAAHRVLRDSGVLTRNEDQESEWHFIHQVFRDYLVAHYLVERPDRVLDWLGAGVNETRTLELWRHACGITADCTPLMRAVATEPKLHAYEKAYWLLAVLSDGVNASGEGINDATQHIVDALESGIAARHISRVEVSDRLWRVILPGSSREIQALGEMVRLLAGGGWTSSRWLAIRLEKASSTIAKQIARLFQKSWNVRKVSDPDQKEVHVLGSR